MAFLILRRGITLSGVKKKKAPCHAQVVEGLECMPHMQWTLVQIPAKGPFAACHPLLFLIYSLSKIKVSIPEEILINKKEHHPLLTVLFDSFAPESHIQHRRSIACCRDDEDKSRSLSNIGKLPT